MTYHGDYHWFDFDDHHLDMMYPMTDLDKRIAKYGTEAGLNESKLLNTPRKPMKLLEYFHTDPHGKYIDYCGEIVESEERGIRFTLTYVVEDNSFRASIHDTDFRLEEEIDFIDNDVAKFMIGEEEYNKLKQINKEEKKNLAI